MELEVKNKSTVYIAEITVVNMVENEPHPETATHVLQPGESKNILVWIDHYLVVKEIGEVVLKKSDPESYTFSFIYLLENVPGEHGTRHKNKVVSIYFPYGNI